MCKNHRLCKICQTYIVEATADTNETKIYAQGGGDENIEREHENVTIVKTWKV